jgi:hypothetical protein
MAAQFELAASVRERQRDTPMSTPNQAIIALEVWRRIGGSGALFSHRFVQTVIGASVLSRHYLLTGQRDWRMPNRRELRSFLSLQNKLPALSERHLFISEAFA